MLLPKKILPILRIPQNDYEKGENDEEKAAEVNAEGNYTAKVISSTDAANQISQIEDSRFADMFDATYDQAMIQIAVDDMITYLDGGTPEKNHVIPVDLVDASNADQFKGHGDALSK